MVTAEGVPSLSAARTSGHSRGRVKRRPARPSGRLLGQTHTDFPAVRDSCDRMLAPHQKYLLLKPHGIEAHLGVTYTAGSGRGLSRLGRLQLALERGWAGSWPVSQGGAVPRALAVLAAAAGRCVDCRAGLSVSSGGPQLLPLHGDAHRVTDYEWRPWPV